jgi:hypothetical protein
MRRRKLIVALAGLAGVVVLWPELPSRITDEERVMTKRRLRWLHVTWRSRPLRQPGCRWTGVWRGITLQGMSGRKETTSQEAAPYEALHLSGPGIGGFSRHHVPCSRPGK